MSWKPDSNASRRREARVREGIRPYVILKYATSSDGFIARSDYTSRWISCAASRALVHKWREEVDAILVGARTALLDDPSLTCRSKKLSFAEQPLRIVLLPNGALPATSHLMAPEAATLLFTSIENAAQITNTPAHVQIHNLDWSQPLIPKALPILKTRGISTLLVEGGAKTLQEFLNAGLWDEARIFIAPVQFKSGVAAPHIVGRTISETKIDTDILRVIVP